MIQKRRRAGRKVDYAANEADRKRLASYMNRTSFDSAGMKRSYSAKERFVRFFISVLGLALFLTGFFFVLF